MRRATSALITAGFVLIVPARNPMAANVNSDSTESAVCRSWRYTEQEEGTEWPRLCLISDDGSPIPSGGPPQNRGVSGSNQRKLTTRTSNAPPNLLDVIYPFIDPVSASFRLSLLSGPIVD
jgi:hypothetical protein